MKAIFSGPPVKPGVIYYNVQLDVHIIDVLFAACIKTKNTG
jgi:hypothetical protein